MADADPSTGSTLILTVRAAAASDPGVQFRHANEHVWLGDVLFVAINSDASVRRLKGPDRPLYSQDDRATLLAALSCVSHVLIFDDETPHRLLHLLRPDVLAKEGTTAEIVGHEVVESYGGEVLHLPQFGANSTTNTVRKIRQRLDEPERPVPYRSPQPAHEPLPTI